ncbi:hypothetical protein D7231_17925 [Streptomyces klenkii]|uniref:Uncharacterized protein n=1 Tax=Streptomyces klenkii TaxID=1420899 RepID=A0A3B0BC12_9ACTN|nr:hypothetical protein D7231_17925 [Streptomyces klenkii]
MKDHGQSVARGAEGERFPVVDGQDGAGLPSQAEAAQMVSGRPHCGLFQDRFAAGQFELPGGAMHHEQVPRCIGDQRQSDESPCRDLPESLCHEVCALLAWGGAPEPSDAVRELRRTPDAVSPVIRPARWCRAERSVAEALVQ